MQISNNLLEAMKDESDSIKASIGRMVFEAARDLKNLNSKNRINQFHELMDNGLRLDLLKSPEKAACQKDCCHCCYMNVDVFDDEAILMADLIKNGQVEIDQTEFEYQKNMDSDDFKNNPRPCIFLKQNECQIYKNRPAACRKYYVTGDVQDCAIQDGSPKIVKILFLPRSEVTYSAMINITPIKGNATLAHMVNKELEKNEGL